MVVCVTKSLVNLRERKEIQPKINYQVKVVDVVTAPDNDERVFVGHGSTLPNQMMFDDEIGSIENKGPSTYDVRKIFGFLDPLPLVTVMLTQQTLVCFWGNSLPHSLRKSYVICEWSLSKFCFALTPSRKRAGMPSPESPIKEKGGPGLQAFNSVLYMFTNSLSFPPATTMSLPPRGEPTTPQAGIHWYSGLSGSSVTSALSTLIKYAFSVSKKPPVMKTTFGSNSTTHESQALWGSTGPSRKTSPSKISELKHLKCHRTWQLRIFWVKNGRFLTLDHHRSPRLWSTDHRSTWPTRSHRCGRISCWWNSHPRRLSLYCRRRRDMRLENMYCRRMKGCCRRWWRGQRFDQHRTARGSAAPCKHRRLPVQQIPRCPRRCQSSPRCSRQRS